MQLNRRRIGNIFCLDVEFDYGPRIRYELRHTPNSPSMAIQYNYNEIVVLHSDYSSQNVDVFNFCQVRGARVINALNNVEQLQRYALKLKHALDTMFERDSLLAAIACVWEKKTGTSATVIAKVKEFFTP